MVGNVSQGSNTYDVPLYCDSTKGRRFLPIIARADGVWPSMTISTTAVMRTPRQFLFGLNFELLHAWGWRDDNPRRFPPTTVTVSDTAVSSIRWLFFFAGRGPFCCRHQRCPASQQPIHPLSHLIDSMVSAAVLLSEPPESIRTMR